jgi:hypothetical protein
MPGQKSIYETFLVDLQDGNTEEKNKGYVVFIAVYAPLIYTAPYVMCLMRADPLRGQAERCWALEIKTFLGPEIATSEASAIWAQ